MNPGWHDVCGAAGAGLIIGSYLLLQIGRLDGRGLAYSALNALGAALVIASLLVDFNLSALVPELFWLGISVLGIALHVRRARRPARFTKAVP